MVKSGEGRREEGIWVRQIKLRQSKLKGRLMLRRNAPLRGAVLGILTYGLSAPVIANTNWDWGGFVSQTGMYTSDNSFFNAQTDDHLSGEFSENGIIGSGTLFDRFDFATQVISRRAGDISTGNPKIDYLQLSYRFNELMDSSQSIKIGRFKTPLGFYNETRDVPFTRSGIILPQGVYWERIRNVRSFINGAQYSVDHRWGLNDFGLRLSYGDLQIDQGEFDALMGTDGAGKIHPHGLSNIAFVHEYDGGRFRWGVSRMSTKLKFKPHSSRLIDENGNLNIFTKPTAIQYDVNVFSAEYNLQKWSYTLEYMRGLTSVGKFSDFFPAIEDEPVACYGQISYRPTEAYEYFVRYEGATSNYTDPRGEEFAQSLRDVLAIFHLTEADFPVSPNYSRYSFDKTIGVGWRPTQNFLLRAEWHRVIGTSWISNYALNTARLTKEWDLVALQISYRFK